MVGAPGAIEAQVEVAERAGQGDLSDLRKILGGRRGLKKSESSDNLGALMGARGRILASHLRNRPLEEKALAARLVEKSVLPLIESRAVKVPVHATYPLDEAAAAYEAFAAGGKLGKIVLVTG